MFWLVTVGVFRPVAELLACRDRALLLKVGGFGAAVVGLLVTASLGVLVLVVLETGGFAVLWLPTGSVLLLGCSSGMAPAAAAGTPGDTLPVTPLFSLLPSEEELRLVGNPLTGSFEAVVGAAGRPTDPDC